MVIPAISPGLDWAKEIICDLGDYTINYLREKGVEPEVLGKYMVRKSLLTNKLRKSDADFIVYIGHGIKNSWVGSHYNFLAENIPLTGALVKDVNDNLLAGRIVYSCSCDTLEELGPSAVDKGCRAFIGFDRECLVNSEDVDEDNLSDFVDMLSVPVRVLMNGYPVWMAVEAFKIGCLWYMALAAKGSDYYNNALRNYEGIGYVGDGYAKLY